MAKGYEETFKLNGDQIKTIVTSNEKEIEKHLSSFLRPPYNHQTQVIGFDMEWSLVHSYDEAFCAKSKCATLQLCDGHTCLIIQLNHLPSFGNIGYRFVYKTLLKFLRQPNVTFVGFCIKDTLHKLEKQYGFGIRNFVELGPLAATAMKMPRLSYCGVDELAFLVNGFDLREHRPLTGGCDWDSEPLSKELAKLATVNMVLPPEVYEETFELNGEQIKTTVTSDEKEIEKHISSFLRPSSNHQTKVIGFDAEWYLFSSRGHLKFGTNAGSGCATIQLWDGHSCLIIQLNHLFVSDSWKYDFAFKSLLNFLCMPNITFVGVGIKIFLAKLEKQYGIVCRNDVELGPLAATAMRMPRLSYCGVDELAFVVNGFDLGEHRPLTSVYDWTCKPLGKDLAKLPTVNVYSYFKIGSTLLQSNGVGGLDTGLVRLW